jgi:hypothetical protein
MRSSLSPLFIAAAAFLPMLILMVGLHLWVCRHRQPGVARLGILRGLRWCLLFVSIAWLVSAVVLASKGEASGGSPFLATASLVIASLIVELQIRQCQRNMAGKFR